LPELPDVEVMRRYLESTSMHLTIAEVTVTDPEVLDHISPQELGRKLHGEQFTNSLRHGKYLFVKTSGNEDWVLLHFGMTGNLKYYRRPESKPEYQSVTFSFKNDYQLSYTSVRKLGKVGIIPDVSEFISQKDLGPDVLQDEFTFQRFSELLENRRGMIKSALMDQQLMAGIGNVYSDEILFQAGIHPRSKVSSLKEGDLKKIFKAMKTVLQTAIDKQTDTDKYPDNYLTPLRGEEGAKCPACSGTIQRIEVAGRGSYFCPECQVRRE